MSPCVNLAHDDGAASTDLTLCFCVVVGHATIKKTTEVDGKTTTHDDDINHFWGVMDATISLKDNATQDLTRNPGSLVWLAFGE